MTDVDEIEQQFLQQGGAEFNDSATLPAGFAQQLPALRADPDFASRERDTHLSFARRLLGQLNDANNLVVKMQKLRTIRAELNALRLLDSIVTTLG
jgi:hypothetical protein